MALFSLTRIREKAALAWIGRLNSPELTQKDLEDFELWLAASPANQAAYIRAEALYNQSAQLRLPTQQLRYPALQPQAFWLSGATACVILIAWLIFSKPTEPQFEQQFYTKIGEQQESVLPDQSRIMLNTQTQVEIVYENQRRLAKLTSGEVYFDITHNPERPFEVETLGGTVRVLGTRFSVKLIGVDALVTVAEGSVSLISENAHLPQHPPRVLLPNQQNTFSRALLNEPAEVVQAESYLAWRNKTLVYQDRPLAEIVQDLNRYFADSIVLAPEIMHSPTAQKKTSAVIQLRDRKTTLAALAQALNLDVHYIPQTQQYSLQLKTP